MTCTSDGHDGLGRFVATVCAVEFPKETLSWPVGVGPTCTQPPYHRLPIRTPSTPPPPPPPNAQTAMQTSRQKRCQAADPVWASPRHLQPILAFFFGKCKEQTFPAPLQQPYTLTIVPPERSNRVVNP
jgi:hypothetical protein